MPAQLLNTGGSFFNRNQDPFSYIPPTPGDSGRSSNETSARHGATPTPPRGNPRFSGEHISRTAKSGRHARIPTRRACRPCSQSCRTAIISPSQMANNAKALQTQQMPCQKLETTTRVNSETRHKPCKTQPTHSRKRRTIAQPKQQMQTATCPSCSTDKMLLEQSEAENRKVEREKMAQTREAGTSQIAQSEKESVRRRGDVLGAQYVQSAFAEGNPAGMQQRILGSALAKAGVPDSSRHGENTARQSSHKSHRLSLNFGPTQLKARQQNMLRVWISSKPTLNFTHKSKLVLLCHLHLRLLHQRLRLPRR